MRQGVGGGDVEGGVNKSALSDENPLWSYSDFNAVVLGEKKYSDE